MSDKSVISQYLPTRDIKGASEERTNELLRTASYPVVGITPLNAASP